MWSYRSTTALGCCTLPWLKPSLITHNIGEGAIGAEAEDVVKQTRTSINISCTVCPPAGITQAITYT